MSVQRGNVVLAKYPLSSGSAAGRRPVLVIQADTYNRRIRNTIVAQITSNLRRAKDPAPLLIELSTPEGAQSGLLHDSVVSCTNLATIREDRIDRTIGQLPAHLLQKVDECLKVALGL